MVGSGPLGLAGLHLLRAPLIPFPLVDIGCRPGSFLCTHRGRQGVCLCCGSSSGSTLATLILKGDLVSLLLKLALLEELVGCLLNVRRHRHVKLEGRDHLEVLVRISIVFHYWQERVILAQIESLFDLAVGNAEHKVLLNVYVDLDLRHGGLLLDAHLAAYNHSLVFLAGGAVRIG